MEFKMSKIATCASVCVATFTLIAAVIGCHNYFTTDKEFHVATDAQAAEIKKVANQLALTNLRLEQKILNDQLYNLQKRKYMIEDRLRTRPNDAGAIQELREIKHDMNVLQKKLNAVTSRSYRTS